jgi:hypothetical protein
MRLLGHQRAGLERFETNVLDLQHVIFRFHISARGIAQHRRIWSSTTRRHIDTLACNA